MNRIGWMVLIFAVCASAAAAQTDPNGQGKPPVQVVPVPPAELPSDAGSTLPGRRGVIGADPTQETLTDVVPDALPEALPVPQPVPVPVAEDQTAQIAALRTAFELLRQRDAADAALRLPATDQTTLELGQVDTAITANEATLEIDTWKAQNFPIFAQSFAAEPRVLPDGIPPGTQPDLALAVIAAQTTLYAQPAPAAENVLRTLDTPSAALRVAELGAMTLIWSSQDGFAFVLTQYRQVY